MSYIVGKVENGRGIFDPGGQTNGFSWFKVDSSVCQCFHIAVLLLSDHVDHNSSPN